MEVVTALGAGDSGVSASSPEATVLDPEIPAALIPFAALLFSRFPEVLLALGHPCLEDDFQLPPSASSFTVIEETGAHKLVQVMLGRRGSEADAVAAAVSKDPECQRAAATAAAAEALKGAELVALGGKAMAPADVSSRRSKGGASGDAGPSSSAAGKGKPRLGNVFSSPKGFAPKWITSGMRRDQDGNFDQGAGRGNDEGGESATVSEEAHALTAPFGEAPHHAPPPHHYHQQQQHIAAEQARGHRPSLGGVLGGSASAPGVVGEQTPSKLLLPVDRRVQEHIEQAVARSPPSVREDYPPPRQHQERQQYQQQYEPYEEFVEQAVPVRRPLSPPLARSPPRLREDYPPPRQHQERQQYQQQYEPYEEYVEQAVPVRRPLSPPLARSPPRLREDYPPPRQHQGKQQQQHHLSLKKAAAEPASPKFVVPRRRSFGAAGQKEPVAAEPKAAESPGPEPPSPRSPGAYHPWDANSKPLVKNRSRAASTDDLCSLMMSETSAGELSPFSVLGFSPHERRPGAADRGYR